MDKGNRGRKRKSAEANAQEPKAKVMWMSEASEPATAPVAQMIAPAAQMIEAPEVRMSEAQVAEHEIAARAMGNHCPALQLRSV